MENKKQESVWVLVQIFANDTPWVAAYRDEATALERFYEVKKLGGFNKDSFDPYTALHDDGSYMFLESCKVN